MQWRPAQPDEIGTLVTMNRQLQEDEHSEVMPTDVLEARLRRWLAAGHHIMMLEDNSRVMGYAVFNNTDADLQGPPGVYLRHFFIAREARRRGVGRQAFELLKRDEWPAGCRILLDAMCSNPDAQRFWRALGFEAYSINYEYRGPH